MQVSLNLKPCPVPEDLKTLREVIDFVERQRVPLNQVINRIVLDGQVLEEEDEQAQAGLTIEQIDLLEFYSARPVDLIIEGLNYALELLPSLVEDLQTVAPELRAGNVQQGLISFAECLNYVGWYIRILESAFDVLTEQEVSLVLKPSATNGIHTPEEELGATNIEIAPTLRSFASRENLRQKLEDIKSAQQNQDLLLLADMIEYELLPIVRLWSDEVPSLLKRVEQSAATA